MKPNLSARLRGPRGIVIAVGLGLLAMGIVGASAASLGGLAPQQIGADSSVIQSCDDDGITVQWGGMAVQSGHTTFSYNQVLLSGVSGACDGADYSVTITNSVPTVLNTSTGTLSVSGGNATITLTGSGSPVSVSESAHIAILLVGP